MLVREKMTTKVVTIKRNDTVEKAMKTMRDNKIRHLPVVDGDKLVGIMAHSDLGRAMPSQVSTLDVREATYLFDRVKVKDALPKDQKVITISPDDYIEEAALLMRSYKIGSLPVVDGEGRLVGIITESNILDAFVELLGVRSTGGRISVELADKPNQVAAIASVIGGQNVKIERIAMFPARDGKNFQAVIRLDTQAVEPIAELLRLNGFKVEEAKSYSATFKG